MKIKQTLSAILILTIILWSTLFSADFEVGKSYSGFKLLEKRFVKEVNAECLNFEHTQSGARLFKIMADDPNKTFSIAFKTIPESDNGAPHIMEHGVLNGSKNFPVKSPFDILSKGSLKTFLNAFTGNNITLYPIASMNEKDYFNLMHVYLDAVFNPLIYSDPRILKQEGWHYELLDKDSSIDYRGIVYNEMKGAFSNPSRELYYHIDKNLFPDNCYQYSAGGYPSVIPTLTYEMYLDYHRKYYHPSNSYVYLYGNGDLNQELAFIDKEYLSTYQKSDANITIPIQRPFDTMKTATASYSFPEEGNPENQTYLSLSFVAGLGIDRKLIFALDILTDVLINQESAPIRLALQEANIGRDVSASYDDLKQNVVTITVQNANLEDQEKFKEIIFKIFQEMVEKGLDEETVQATLNRLEFRLRESDDAQKGLTYHFNQLNGWLFANDPFLNLEWEKPLAAIKDGLKEKYLEAVIQQYFLDNPHALLLALQPTPGMEKEINAQTVRELAAYKSNLSNQDLENLINETQELIAYQQKEDTPEALATIPSLSIEDINPKAQYYKIQKKQIQKVPVFYYDTFTNAVVYVRYLYDARVVPQGLIPYISLLAQVMGSLNTEHYTFGELEKELNLHTGGFSTYLGSYLKEQDDNQLQSKYIIAIKAMNSKIDKLFELSNEIILNTKYDDKERLRDVLTRHQSQLEASLKSNGYAYASRRLRSYYSNQGFFTELTSGVEYYWFITDLLDNFDAKADEIINNLQQTANLLFNKNNLIITITCDKSDIKNILNYSKTYLGRQPTNEIKLNNWQFTPTNKKEGLMAASKVQYVVLGSNFKKLGYQWSGKLRVLDHILSSDWLYNQIRIVGGAYGAWSNFSTSGNVDFNSYRDPNLKETLKIYKGTIDYLHNFDSDQRTMTNYIIGTIANLDNPLTPSEQGNLAVRYYLENISEKDIQKERDEVLSTTVKEIREMEQMVADILNQNTYCVYGNEEVIQTNETLFNTVVKLSR